jgi:FKBP-type peptidyl-prolyl cis-trans isomerase FklB
MARLFIVAFSLSIALTTQAQDKKSSKSTNPNQKTVMIKTKADKFSYAIGINIAQSIQAQGLSDSINVQLLAKAFDDVLKKLKLDITPEEAQNVIQQYMMEAQSKAGEKNAREGKKFLEENAKRKGVVTLPSGLQYEVIKEGDGISPKETDQVTVHYHGTLINGEVFDSSIERGQPATFPVNGVIRGWVEALQLMKTGSKWKLYIPSELAYGDRSAGPKIGPGSTLIFEVELLSVGK